MTASKAKFDALFHKYGSLWRSLSSHPDVLREIATIESIVSSRHHNDTVHTPNDPSQINQILDISDPSLNINLSSTHARSRFDPSVLSIHDSRDDDSSSASRVNVSKECIIDLVSSSSESIIEIDLSHLKINDDGEVVDDRDRKNTSDFGYDKFPSKLIDCSSSISSHSSSLGDECEWEEIKDAVCLSTSEHSYSSTSFDVLVVDDDSISNGNVSDYEDEDECVPPLDTTSRPVSKSMRLEFTRQRDALTQQYFDMFNETVFEHSLSEAHILWSKILRTTAGYCKCRTKSQQNQRMAEIELSIKVVDSEDKLKNTLMHEMCHAAAWLVDGITKPPHGECFKKWASLAMKRCPGVVVTTRHDYKIAYKYAWGCSNPICDVVIQRHSRSFKVDRYRCAKCKSPFVEIELPEKNTNSADSGHQIKKRRDATGFSLFVKEKSAEVRSQLLEQRKNVSQPEVMKECARLWALRKQEYTLPDPNAYTLRIQDGY